MSDVASSMRDDQRKRKVMNQQTQKLILANHGAS
jgi:hypothetical protein